MEAEQSQKDLLDVLNNVRKGEIQQKKSVTQIPTITKIADGNYGTKGQPLEFLDILKLNVNIEGTHQNKKSITQIPTISQMPGVDEDGKLEKKSPNRKPKPKQQLKGRINQSHQQQPAKNKDMIEEEIKDELSMIDFTNSYLQDSESEHDISIQRIQQKLELKKKKLLDQEKHYLDYFEQVQNELDQQFQETQATKEKETISRKLSMISDWEQRYKIYFDNVQGSLNRQINRDSMLISDVKDADMKRSMISQYENKYYGYFDSVQNNLDHQFHKDSMLLLNLDDDSADDQNQYFVSPPKFKAPMDIIDENSFDQIKSSFDQSMRMRDNKYDDDDTLKLLNMSHYKEEETLNFISRGNIEMDGDSQKFSLVQNRKQNQDQNKKNAPRMNDSSSQYQDSNTMINDSFSQDSFTDDIKQRLQDPQRKNEQFQQKARRVSEMNDQLINKNRLEIHNSRKDSNNSEIKMSPTSDEAQQSVRSTFQQNIQETIQYIEQQRSPQKNIFNEQRSQLGEDIVLQYQIDAKMNLTQTNVERSAVPFQKFQNQSINYQIQTHSQDVKISPHKKNNKESLITDDAKNNNEELKVDEKSPTIKIILNQRKTEAQYVPYKDELIKEHDQFIEERQSFERKNVMYQSYNQVPKNNLSKDIITIQSDEFTPTQRAILVQKSDFKSRNDVFRSPNISMITDNRNYTTFNSVLSSEHNGYTPERSPPYNKTGTSENNNFKHSADSQVEKIKQKRRNQDILIGTQSSGEKQQRLAPDIQQNRSVNISQLDISEILNSTNNQQNQYNRKELGSNDNTFISALRQFQSSQGSFLDNSSQIDEDENDDQLDSSIESPLKSSSPESSIRARNIEEEKININLIKVKNSLESTPQQQQQQHQQKKQKFDENEEEEKNNEWNKMVREAQESIKRVENENISKNKQKLKDLKKQEQTKGRTYLRQYVKISNHTLNQNYEANHLKHFSQKTFLSSENPLLLEDNMLFLILVGNKNLPTYIIADQGASRCRQYFKNLIKKYQIHQKLNNTKYRSTTCHEAYFGLAKIYYHLNKHEISLECINKAIQSRQNDPLYFLWKSLILFWNLKSKTITELATDIKSAHLFLKECESSMQTACELNKSSVAVRLMLLKITSFIEKVYARLQYKPLKPSKEYAVQIAKMDQYLGYIAWTEIYLNDPEKKQLGYQVLEDLIVKEASKPQAYLKLWQQYVVTNQKQKALELAEKLFIYGTGFQSLEIKIIITLMYAKSLYINLEYIRAFELLQNEIINTPDHSSLLFVYGKYIIKSQQINFMGSAIGALEECLRACIKERHGKIYYYLGLAYKVKKQGIKAYEYWNLALKTLTSKGSGADRKKEIKEYNEEFRFTSALQNLFIFYFLLDLKLQKSRLSLRFKDYNNYDDARKCFNKLIAEFPNFIEAYQVYWQYLKCKKEYDEMKIIAENAIEKSENSSVPTSMWVEARMMMSKTFLLNKEIDKSIQALNDICFILPPFPIDKLQYIAHVLEGDPDQENESKEDNMEFNQDENQDKIAEGNQDQHQQLQNQQYSQERTGSLTFKVLKTPSAKSKKEFNFEQRPNSIDNQQIVFTNNRAQIVKHHNSDQQLLQLGSMRQSMAYGMTNPRKVTRVFVNDASKRSMAVGGNGMVQESYKNYGNPRQSIAQKRDDQNDDNGEILETHIDSEGFAIYSNAKFLFQIGKICAETGFKLEDGLKAITDYISIIEYFKNDMPEGQYERSKLKSHFYIGTIFYRVKDFEASMTCLAEILLQLKENHLQDMFNKAQDKIGKIFKRNNKQLVTDYFK